VLIATVRHLGGRTAFAETLTVSLEREQPQRGSFPVVVA
jgi:hypothetical protein